VKSTSKIQGVFNGFRESNYARQVLKLSVWNKI